MLKFRFPARLLPTFSITTKCAVLGLVLLASIAWSGDSAYFPLEVGNLRVDPDRHGVTRRARSKGSLLRTTEIKRQTSADQPMEREPDGDDVAQDHSVSPRSRCG